MAIKYIIVLFVETPRKFITAKLSIRKHGSSSVLIICDLFNSHALFFIYKSVVICWLASFEHFLNGASTRHFKRGEVIPINARASKTREINFAH
jgi:hypothetical protein